LISGGADIAEVAASASAAAESSMVAAANDRAFRESFWLLTQIPLAARSDDYVTALRGLDVLVSDSPTLVEICTACMATVDRHVLVNGGRTDAGEMAQLCAVEALSAVAGREMAGLLGPAAAADETRIALAGLATVAQFSVLAHDFFARLARRYLEYYLSRELPEHAVVSSRFHTLREQHEFERALESHCREAALIMREFAGEWFSKTNYEGGIDLAKASGFAHYAFEKIRAELRVRREAVA
jgi:hypothetical protein